MYIGQSNIKICTQVTCVPTSSEHEIMDGSLDAVMLSPHKLVGGPGSCGVLIVRRSIVRTEEPQSPGATLHQRSCMSSC